LLAVLPVSVKTSAGKITAGDLDGFTQSSLLLNQTGQVVEYAFDDLLSLRPTDYEEKTGPSYRVTLVGGSRIAAVDLSLTEHVDAWNAEYDADPGRYGDDRATVAQPVKVDNDLYVRDYAKCILCYQCVDACGEQWQNSFVIEIAGRGFDSHVSTEDDVALTDSACVYCGNCIQVCPTGALMPTSEFEMRAAGTWDEDAQTTTDTICAFCGVGCGLTLHVQENTIVKVSSPEDNEITHGNLCIKGRFGFTHVQSGRTTP